MTEFPEKPVRLQIIWFCANHPGCCFYCGVALSINSLTVDHVIPTSAGGANSAGNKVPCCYVCNQWKRDMTLERFRHSRRRVGLNKAGFYFELEYAKRELSLALPSPPLPGWVKVVPPLKPQPKMVDIGMEMEFKVTYMSYKKKHNPETIFVCGAEDLLDADGKLLDGLGVVAAKEPRITAAVERVGAGR